MYRSEQSAETQRHAVNPTPSKQRAVGVTLRGNPTIIAHPKAKINCIFGNRTINLFNKVRRADDRGIPLNRLARNRYERWLVRVMVKARAVKVVEKTA